MTFGISPFVHPTYRIAHGIVGTRFDGGFVLGGKDGVGIGLEGALSDEVRQWRVKRVREVLNGLGPTSWETETTSFATGDEPNTQQQSKRSPGIHT
ncbi:uncharacterized protein F5891DRAFT_1235315 [Suillus fuscotomentosus]|uniref:Uncharacterized protein n=1 Tax=Suillus fuscotomentosus TaxID=1912939 RepID=A0AAD4HJL2_9AGAM|nr:uncharacterized protein F5891DRAFT_1235315 [Suillus fuscotomentosus]KAG1898993.1 hypothetical protein F5891DRAFT_1235315 [Suillus fuscotomentosus]